MKKKWSKRKKWTMGFGIFLLIIIIGLPLITRLAPMVPREADVTAYFEKKGVEPSFETYNYKNRSMHYVSVGADSLPMILFVHGSPGHWTNFQDFLTDPELLGRFRLVAVDRPGYGSSTGGVELSLEEQAAAIAPILSTNKSSFPTILVGHSFGGGVVARINMDFSEQVGGLVLAAPTLAPELEEIMLIQHIGNFPPFRWLIADWLDVCNQEMQPLANELEKTAPLWKNIFGPVTMIHGDADWIVPVGNIEYLEKMLPHNPPKVIRFETMNHFIPWENPQLIRNGILDTFEQLKGEEPIDSTRP